MKPLKEYKQFTNADLLGENYGWELNMPFNSEGELIKLVDLFLRKSGDHIYDKNGVIIEEIDKEKSLRAPWRDAYETPVLILGEIALKYANKLPHFIPATKIILRENFNEISFIINKNLGLLRNLPHYEQLKRMGFNEELCLGNKPFIIGYVDKER